jgi:hypothetical protein
MELLNKKRFTFKELTPAMQSHLLRYRVEAFLLKGIPLEESNAMSAKEFRPSRRKSKASWSAYKYQLMCKVDRRRVKLGLPKLYFPDIIVTDKQSYLRKT